MFGEAPKVLQESKIRPELTSSRPLIMQFFTLFTYLPTYSGTYNNRFRNG